MFDFLTVHTGYTHPIAPVLYLGMYIVQYTYVHMCSEESEQIDFLSAYRLQDTLCGSLVFGSCHEDCEVYCNYTLSQRKSTFRDIL